MKQLFAVIILPLMLNSCNWELSPKLKRGSDLDEWIFVDEQYPDSTDKTVGCYIISKKGFELTKEFKYTPHGDLQYAQLIGKKISTKIRYFPDGQLESVIFEGKDSLMDGPFIKRSPNTREYSVFFYAHGKARSQVEVDSNGAFSTLSYFPYNAEELYIQFDSIGNIEVITEKNKGVIYDNRK